MRPYRQFFDRVLTRTDPERAHGAAFRAIRAAQPVTRMLNGRRTKVEKVSTTRVMGLEFPGLMGLAAGFDKNGVGMDALANMGFGFIEIGTITGEPQPGNPKPRLVRLPADRAVVNRMGFNNDGAELVSRRLAERRLDRTGRELGVPLGINIGKTKVVPENDAVRDYEKSTTLLAPYADYLVVNVSSPNTPGLRDMQAVQRLDPLLRAVRSRADEIVAEHVPLLVKIAPDLDDKDVLEVADLAVAQGLDGIIATNTTVSREGLALAGRAGRGRRCRRAFRPSAARACQRGDATPARPRRAGPDADRCRRDQHSRGRDRAAGRRGRPAAGLHRVRLRGSLVAGPHQRQHPGAPARPEHSIP